MKDLITFLTGACIFYMCATLLFMFLTLFFNAIGEEFKRTTKISITITLFVIPLIPVLIFIFA